MDGAAMAANTREVRCAAQLLAGALLADVEPIANCSAARMQHARLRVASPPEQTA